MKNLILTLILIPYIGYGQFERNYQNGREGSRNSYRGGRGPGIRDSGGFRIRLSDNEMRASNSLQEAFNLRSTVAVLGFALRTLAQMLEEGKLDEFLKEYRAQVSNQINKKEQTAKKSRFNENKSFQDTKPNPFARPSKPQADQTQSNDQVEELIKKGQDQSQPESKENEVQSIEAQNSSKTTES